jgi:hypothetical protein
VCCFVPDISVLNRISAIHVLSRVILMLPTLQCLGLPNVVFVFGFLEQKLCTNLSPCMLHTPYMSSFDSSFKQNFEKRRDYEPRHHEMFFIPLLPPPFSPRYHSQHPILIHPQPVFHPPCERSGSTPNANIIVNHLWNWIICFVLISSHFSQMFDERTIHDQLLCQYQHRQLSVISSVWINNLIQRMLDKIL